MRCPHIWLYQAATEADEQRKLAQAREEQMLLEILSLKEQPEILRNQLANAVLRVLVHHRAAAKEEFPALQQVARENEADMEVHERVKQELTELQGVARSQKQDLEDVRAWRLPGAEGVTDDKLLFAGGVQDHLKEQLTQVVDMQQEWQQERDTVALELAKEREMVALELAKEREISIERLKTCEKFDKLEAELKVERAWKEGGDSKLKETLTDLQQAHAEIEAHLKCQAAIEHCLEEHVDALTENKFVELAEQSAELAELELPERVQGILDVVLTNGAVVERKGRIHAELTCEKKLEALYGGMGNVICKYREGLRALFPETAAEKDARDEITPVTNCIKRVRMELQDVVELAQAQEVSRYQQQAEQEANAARLQTAQDKETARLTTIQSTLEVERSALQTELKKAQEALLEMSMNLEKLSGVQQAVEATLDQQELEAKQEFQELEFDNNGEIGLFDRVSNDLSELLRIAVMERERKTEALHSLTGSSEIQAKLEGAEVAFQSRLEQNALEIKDTHDQISQTRMALEQIEQMEDFTMELLRAVKTEVGPLYEHVCAAGEQVGIIEQMTTVLRGLIARISDVEMSALKQQGSLTLHRHLMQTELIEEQATRTQTEQQLSVLASEHEYVSQALGEANHSEDAFTQAQAAAQASEDSCKKAQAAAEAIVREHRELEYGVAYALGKHRSELADVFPELAERRNHHDESTSGASHTPHRYAYMLLQPKHYERVLAFVNKTSSSLITIVLFRTADGSGGACVH